MNSVFAEDQPVEQRIDGYATRQEAEVIWKKLSVIGFPVAKVTEDRSKPVRPDGKAYLFHGANGHVIDVSGAETGLAMDPATFLAQYPGIAASGPVGVNWHCTEEKYYSVRNRCAQIGLVVQGGGTISENVDDIEAIGQKSFGLPPIGVNTKANFVIQFPSVDGSEPPVCNAAYLDVMLGLSPAAAKALVASRAVRKGWRASAGFSGFVPGFGGGE